MNHTFFPFFRQICLLSLASLFLPLQICADDRVTAEKLRMIDDLSVIKHHFEVGYAPIYWKQEYVAWDLNQSFEDAKEEILSTPFLSQRQFQEILLKFCAALRDYHVNISFYSNERASLPFSVKTTEGRYFIDWVDPRYFPKKSRSLAKGDELILFDGQPVAEVARELKPKLLQDVQSETEEAIAATKLTLRLGSVGDAVPQGSILITTRSASTGKKRQHQFRWNYTPNYIPTHNPENPTAKTAPSLRNYALAPLLKQDPLRQREQKWPITENITPLNPPVCCAGSCVQPFFNWTQNFEASNSRLSFSPNSLIKPITQKDGMISSSFQDLATAAADREGSLGSRKSFLPPLGPIIWKYVRPIDLESDSLSNASLDPLENEKKNPSVFWHAYIYEHENDYSVGYIRIPHYELLSGAITELGKILSYMEKHTEVLVIDQLHNFGGYLLSLYEIASMLAESAMKVPLHRMKITQKEAMEAYRQLEWIKETQKRLDFAEQAQTDALFNEEEEERFSFISQHLLSLKAFCEEILHYWREGQTLTPLLAVDGIDFINPHPKYGYGKPIVMLIDGLDFSAADFMPAILQDNKRALLFGEKTAGAGGCVSLFEFPNHSGIAHCSYTNTIAERVNGEKIENLGVFPDIYYKKTVEDLAYGYQDYIKNVNQAVDAQLQQNQR